MILVLKFGITTTSQPLSLVRHCINANDHLRNEERKQARKLSGYYRQRTYLYKRCFTPTQTLADIIGPGVMRPADAVLKLYQILQSGSSKIIPFEKSKCTTELQRLCDGRASFNCIDVLQKMLEHLRKT